MAMILANKSSLWLELILGVLITIPTATKILAAQNLRGICLETFWESGDLILFYVSAQHSVTKASQAKLCENRLIKNIPLSHCHVGR